MHPQLPASEIRLAAPAGNEAAGTSRPERSERAAEPQDTPERMPAPLEPAEPTAPSTVAAHGHGLKSEADIASGLAGGVTKMIGAMFEVFANMFAPAAPPSPDQQRRDRQAAGERAEFRRFVAEQSQALFSVNENIRDQEQQRRREQEERDARRSRDDRQR